MCRRPDLVCRLVNQFNTEVSYQNLANDFPFQKCLTPPFL